MAGQIRNIMEAIIRERSLGNPAIAEMTKAKFILKGLRLEHYDHNSPDDPLVIDRLLQLKGQLAEASALADRVNILSVYTTLPSEPDAVDDLKAKLGPIGAKLLIFFASSSYDLDRLSRLMTAEFPDCAVIGCSTAGEIATGLMLNHSVVAMAFNANVITDAKVEIVENLNAGPDVGPAFDAFDRYFSAPSGTLDPARHVGLVLVDGLSLKHEALMDQIGNKTNIYFVGGSAGDDEKYVRTYVCANGRAYTDAALLVLLRLHERASFDIVKTQSFRRLDRILLANKVDEATREVIEFNHEPAITAYARAVGIESEEDAPDYFMTNPLGLVIEADDIFVRSPLQKRGTSIRLFCSLLEGMEVSLLESTDIVADTRQVLARKLAEFGRIEGLLNFNCILRTRQLQRMNQLSQYGELFRSFPTAGFSTYGEEYIGHINQTATMLVFKTDADTSADAHPLPEACLPLPAEARVPAAIAEADDRAALLLKISELSHLLKERDLQLAQTTAALRQINISLEEEIHARSRREEEIRYLSFHDQLTGLYNRRFYEMELERLDAPQYLPISIVIADVNNLKSTNDTYGHDSGDLLIRRTAEGFRKACRENDIIARWGGDEFAILLPNTDADKAERIVGRIREQYRDVSVMDLPVSVSFGIATRTLPEQSLSSIMTMAEKQMYANKRGEKMR